MRAIFVLLVLALTLAPAGAVLADDDVGCGVGTQILDGKSGLAAKIGASFINGLTFQSVSLTFGLLNCDGRGMVTADARDLKLRHYASQNFDRLAEDMAKGRGESLAAFAHLLQVSDEDGAEFRAFAQRHFAELFAHDEVTVGEMLSSLDRLLAEDERLSAYARS